MTEATDPPGGRVTADLIHEAIESNRQVASATESMALAMVEYQERAKLAEKRDHEAKQRDADARVRDRKLLRAVIVGFSAVVLVLIVGLVFLAYRQAVTNDATQDARRTIVDCVTPAGKCYQDGQKRTADIVGKVLQGSIIAAVCANQETSGTPAEQVRAAEKCLADTLAEVGG